MERGETACRRTPSPPVAYNPLLQRDSWKIKPFRASGVPVMCTQEVSMKLYKRPDGRSENWYVRLIIPSALQSAFKSDRFIASTKSSDKVLARARAAAIVEKWERKLYETRMKKREKKKITERRP